MSATLVITYGHNKSFVLNSAKQKLPLWVVENWDSLVVNEAHKAGVSVIQHRPNPYEAYGWVEEIKILKRPEDKESRPIKKFYTI